MKFIVTQGLQNFASNDVIRVHKNTLCNLKPLTNVILSDRFSFVLAHFLQFTECIVEVNHGNEIVVKFGDEFLVLVWTLEDYSEGTFSSNLFNSRICSPP